MRRSFRAATRIFEVGPVSVWRRTKVVGMQRRIEFGRYRALAIALVAVFALQQQLRGRSCHSSPARKATAAHFTGTAPAAGWFSNATVYHVTNLNDSGAGSFRGAFAENTANKIIVFDVGGIIQLTSDSLDIKNVQNYYIAGQTAPSPVTIYGDTTQITHSNNKVQQNVILRYLTFRKGTGEGEDAITFAGGGTNGIATNMILDHVSASWAEDEILSVANNNTNVTVQYSIIADALTSGHAYGSLIRPRTDSNVTFHHNLYANNASRQARFGTYDAETLTADFRNNVIYNWRDRASYAGGSCEAEQEFADVNYVGNYLVAGPGTVGNCRTSRFQRRQEHRRPRLSIGQLHRFRQASEPGTACRTVRTPVGACSACRRRSPTRRSRKWPTPFATRAGDDANGADAYDQVIDHVGNCVVVARSDRCAHHRQRAHQHRSAERHRRRGAERQRTERLARHADVDASRRLRHRQRRHVERMGSRSTAEHRSAADASRLRQRRLRQPHRIHQRTGRISRPGPDRLQRRPQQPLRPHHELEDERRRAPRAAIGSRRSTTRRRSTAARWSSTPSVSTPAC